MHSACETDGKWYLKHRRETQGYCTLYSVLMCSCVQLCCMCLCVFYLVLLCVGLLFCSVMCLCVFHFVLLCVGLLFCSVMCLCSVASVVL